MSEHPAPSPAADVVHPEPGAAAPAPTGIRGRVKEFRRRHERAEGILFFAGGFVFDAVMVKRIDEVPMLVQQGAYLVLVGVLLALTQSFSLQGKAPPQALHKVWHFLEHVIHFMLGTLLNAYTIFYFQSASGFTAVAVLGVIAAFLAVNEMPRFHRRGPVVLYALYSVCLTSYLAYVVPYKMHHLAPWMFYSAVALGLIPVALLVSGVVRWSKSVRRGLGDVLVPALAVQTFLLAVYVLRLVPPVPLALKEIGIYHNVARAQRGVYRLTHERHTIELWKKDDQDFHERSEEKVWAFVRLFAPRYFSDRVRAVWFYDDPKGGWRQYSSVPLLLTASGERGFATYSYLTSPPEGDFRVEMQSMDGRTIGQRKFHVTKDASDSSRELVEDMSSSEDSESTHKD